MKKTEVAMLLALGAYSAVLVAVELQTSQAFVRNFFTDIEGPVPFYAVNTSVSVFLLWATSLVFLISIACIGRAPDRTRLYWFYVSQALVFFFLGFDDRFKFHEGVAWRIGIPDHFLLLTVGVLEVALLFLLGGFGLLKSRAGWLLGIASLLFAVMIFIDGFVSHDMTLRLSTEDLAKTWAALFFFLFSWELLRGHLDELKSAAGPLFRSPVSGR